MAKLSAYGRTLVAEVKSDSECKDGTMFRVTRRLMSDGKILKKIQWQTPGDYVTPGTWTVAGTFGGDLDAIKAGKEWGGGTETAKAGGLMV